MLKWNRGLSQTVGSVGENSLSLLNIELLLFCSLLFKYCRTHSVSYLDDTVFSVHFTAHPSEVVSGRTYNGFLGKEGKLGGEGKTPVLLRPAALSSLLFSTHYRPTFLLAGLQSSCSNKIPIRWRGISHICFQVTLQETCPCTHKWNSGCIFQKTFCSLLQLVSQSLFLAFFSSIMEKRNNCVPSLKVTYHLKKCFKFYHVFSNMKKFYVSPKRHIKLQFVLLVREEF